MVTDNNGPFGFEKLLVWKKAVAFARTIYATTKTFPRDEVFGLVSQLKRASVSVAANIAEGASRSSGKDRARFAEMAFGSLNEIATLLYIASGEEFIQQQQFNECRAEIRELGRMLSGLRKAALSS
jgi:four helix bundle protein